MALTDNIVSYWKLNETSGTRADSAGSNNLTDNNSVSYTTGKISNAATFVRSSSQSLSCASNASLQISGSFTMSMWIKFQTLTNYNIFANKGNGAEFWIYTASNGGGDYQIGSGSVGSQQFPNGTFTTDTWYFIVFWWDSVGNQMGYSINNGTAVTAGTSGSPTVGSSDFTLGSANGTHYCDAYIDEVGRWSRVLTSAERTELYNGGAGLTYPFVEIQEWYFTWNY